MRSNSELENFILDFLYRRGAGEAFAIALPALTKIAGERFHQEISASEIRQAVRNLRLVGNPLCSSNSGYYWPSSLKDVDLTIRTKFLSPAKSELRLANRMRLGAQRYFGVQSEFEDLYLAVSAEREE